jgi:hypothetical protein
MNPGTVLGQSIAACVFLTTLAVVERPVVTIALSLAGGLWALTLNHLYARKLGARGRTPRRIKGDQAIARQLLLSYGIPMGVGVALLLTGGGIDPNWEPFRASEVQGLVGVIATMLVIWIASSHVDWYYIRPRIDGVVVDPPCRTSRDTRWKGVTRNWYVHRAFASAMTMLTVVGIASIVTVVLNREWPSGLAAIGGFAAILSVGLWLMQDEIKSAGPTSRAIRTPRYWLGDDLSYDTDMWRRRGFVLHVAIPQTKLVPLDRETGSRVPDADFVEEPTTRLAAAYCHSVRFAGCVAAGNKCGEINPECLYGQQREDAGRHRVFVT